MDWNFRITHFSSKMLFLEFKVIKATGLYLIYLYYIFAFLWNSSLSCEIASTVHPVTHERMLSWITGPLWSRLLCQHYNVAPLTWILQAPLDHVTYSLLLVSCLWKLVTAVKSHGSNYWGFIRIAQNILSCSVFQLVCTWKTSIPQETFQMGTCVCYWIMFLLF